MDAAQQDYYRFLGFETNPFENNTAEREPHIELYAVRPPYLDRVQTASNAKGIFVLKGSRGSGKSATRLTVAKTLWSQTPSPLVISLINYNVFRPYVRSSVPLELYANQICFLTVEQVLSWLSAKESGTSEDLLRSLSTADHAFIRTFISNFYLNRPESARRASAAECLEALDMSLTDKGRLWMDKRWDQLATVIAGLASKLGQKYFEVDMGDARGYEELLKRQKAAGFEDPLYAFSKAVEFARLFGFDGLTIHVDKVDETDWTTNSAEAAADLIYPLLTNIQLHELDGLTWRFFIWDKVTDQMQGANRPVRWDKIPNGVIVWDERYLQELVSSRLKYFSSGNVTGLGDICTPDVAHEAMLGALITVSQYSPRNLITLLDTILSEHMQKHQSNHNKLDQDSFDLGMDAYAQNSLANAGLAAAAENITKVGLLEFATSDVMKRFRISSPAARARIDSWVQTGLLEFHESRVGPSGGRPVDYFAVVDMRVSRIIERQMRGTQ